MVVPTVDLSLFTFGTEEAMAAAAQDTRLRERYKANSYTESSRWKALEPHQQAYVRCVFV